MVEGGNVDDRYDKAFPVSWEQFHRDARALTWRLAEHGPFHAVVAITRGGLCKGRRDVRREGCVLSRVFHELAPPGRALQQRGLRP